MKGAVYTLWRHPQLVPLLYTQEFVVQKLCTGSPLMTPGLARGPPFPSEATKGAVVAIASVERPSVPLVVGICETDVAALQKVQGTKGHAVRSEHWEGDELWAWSTSGKSGSHAPQNIEGWEVADESPSLEHATECLAVQDQDDDADDGGVPLPLENLNKSKNEYVDGEDAEPFERVEEEKELSTKDIDNAFWQAFLYGVHQARKKHKDDQHHGLNFPVPQSLVISNLVLPYLPIHTPAQATALSIKKTSWKNARKFIKALEKAKILKSKDRDGGECVVTDIDFEDPVIKNFVTYKLPEKDNPSAQSHDKDVDPNAPQNDPSISQRLKQLTLYRPKEAISPIFTQCSANPKALYLATELRAIMDTYFKLESLISPTNNRLITLNPLLSNSVFNPNNPIDREVIAKGTVPRDALIDRILHLCAPHHAILQNDASREEAKPRPGPAPKIQIVLETRSGNKTVTKVSGVETYYVNPHALAEELQKACASSTSVGQLVGSSPKQPVMEVLVQGPQREVVVKALERRGVKREWVEVVDKVKGKKR